MKRLVVATDENFSEPDYLEANEDVAASVARGEIDSGFTHFQKWGRSEKRLIRLRRSYPPLSTPVPDDELIFLISGLRNYGEYYAASRRGAVVEIIEMLEEVGLNAHDFRSILDFGCGCGRILAGWEGLLHADAKLYGCDINEQLVTFCQENIPQARVVQNGYLPPLPYADQQIDLIYAASVYTHLTLPAMLSWTGEIARLLKPGGIAMITTHGSHYAPILAKESEEGSRILAERGYYVLHPDKSEDTWLGSNRYAAFASPDFIQRIFVGFDLMGVFPGCSRGPNYFMPCQDVLIFRRT